jgi:hypothetical protein
VALLEQQRLAAPRDATAPAMFVAVSKLRPKVEQVVEVRQPRQGEQAARRDAAVQPPQAWEESPASQREVLRRQAAGPQAGSAQLLA